MIKDYLCLNLCISKFDVTKRQIVLSPFKTIEIFFYKIFPPYTIKLLKYCLATNTSWVDITHLTFSSFYAFFPVTLMYILSATNINFSMFGIHYHNLKLANSHIFVTWQCKSSQVKELQYLKVDFALKKLSKGTEFLPQTQIFLSLYLGNPMS